MTFDLDATASLPPRVSSHTMAASTNPGLQRPTDNRPCCTYLAHPKERASQPRQENLAFFVQPQCIRKSKVSRLKAPSWAVLLAGNGNIPSIVVSAGLYDPIIDLDSYRLLDSPIPSFTPLKVIIRTKLSSGESERHSPECTCEWCCTADHANRAAMKYFGVPPPPGEKKQAQHRPQGPPNGRPLLGWDWVHEPGPVAVQEPQEEKKRWSTLGFGEYISKKARSVVRNSRPGRSMVLNVGEPAWNVERYPSTLWHPSPSLGLSQSLRQGPCTMPDNEKTGLGDSKNTRTRAASEPTPSDMNVSEPSKDRRKRSLERIQEEENRILKRTAAENYLDSKRKKGELKFFQKLEVGIESEVSTGLRKKKSFSQKCSTVMKFFKDPEEKESIATTRPREQSHAYMA